MYSKSPSKSVGDCWSVWCCPGRCAWFRSLFVGVITLFAIAAFVVALYAWSLTSFATSYRTYTSNGGIATSPANHLLASSIPLVMTLPNNLIEYVGGLYHIDCASPLAHTVTIQPGVLATTWDGTNKVMTCTLGTPGGVTFRVVTPTLIRIVGSKSVTFSP